MEFTFSQLKQKDVINLNDGKNLGRVCDVTFAYPENALLGLTVTGGKGFRFTKQDVFIPISAVVKIGEDAVLVKTGGGGQPPECLPKRKENCPPKRKNNCPPPCPPVQNCPPDRRSYDEYE